MYVAGIDAGSVGTKAVILDAESTQILTYVVRESEPDVEGLSRQVLDAALAQAGLRHEDVRYIVGTGYGRNIIPFANANRTEIACHALGVNHLLPTVRTIIDVGGQDCKAIRVTADGRIKQFMMNERCAAGTGRFSEVMAKALDTPFEQWGPMVRQAPRRAKISSYCTVFAESEAISLMAQKTPLDEILAGLCEATVNRIAQMVLKMGAIEKDVCFTGGVAYNGGIVHILNEKLGTDVRIPETPQGTGALGAAIFAKRIALSERPSTAAPVGTVMTLPMSQAKGASR